MDNESRQTKKISNSFLMALIWIACTVWLINYGSEIFNNAWGNITFYKLDYVYQIVNIFIVGVLMWLFKAEREKTKEKQRRLDAENNIYHCKQEKENSLKQLQFARDLAKSQDNTELTHTLNMIINDYGNKLTLTELEYPELAALLINKVTEANNDTRFEIEIEKNIGELTYIPADNIVKLFDYLIDQITNAQENINYDKRIVNLLIKEGYNREGIVFEFVHSAPLSATKTESNLTTTALNWFKARRIVNKYKGVLQVINYDKTTIIIKVYLPYQVQQKRQKLNSGL